MTKLKEGYKETEIGVIPEDWGVKKINDCVLKIYGGGTPSRSNSEYYNGNIPWITVKDLDNKFYKADASEYITEEAIKNSATNLIKENSIIVATRMGLGRGFINTKPVTINQDMKALVPKKNIEPRFFLFWYLSKASMIESLGTGTTVKGIRLETLRELKLPFPPFAEQQCIAEILSTADEHIEKLDKVIEDYQFLKKGMMKKLLTEGIGHTEFKETEIGRIPKEWEVKELGDLVTIRSGYSPSNFAFDTNGRFPFFKVDDMNYTNKYLTKSKVYFDTATFNLMNEGMVVFPKRGASIFTNKVTILNKDCFFDTNIMGLTVKDNLYNEFLYYTLKFIGLQKLADITAVPQINNKHINPLKISLPPLPEQRCIAKILSELDNAIELYQRERGNFIQLKKALVEQLLTGKIRVAVKEKNGN